MTVEQMRQKLSEYPPEAVVICLEEPTGSVRKSGEHYTFQYDGETLHVIRDTEELQAILEEAQPQL